MVLVDTSVWIDHFRKKNEYLSGLLINGEVTTHPFIIGELACGSLKNRSQILEYLSNLPKAEESDHEEALIFLEKRNLFSKGIGWVDANILLSSFLTNAKLWTLDNKLRKIAVSLDVNYVINF